MEFGGVAVRDALRVFSLHGQQLPQPVQEDRGRAVLHPQVTLVQRQRCAPPHAVRQPTETHHHEPSPKASVGRVGGDLRAAEGHRGPAAGVRQPLGRFAKQRRRQPHASVGFSTRVDRGKCVGAEKEPHHDGVLFVVRQDRVAQRSKNESGERRRQQWFGQYCAGWPFRGPARCQGGHGRGQGSGVGVLDGEENYTTEHGGVESRKQCEQQQCKDEWV